MKSCTPTRPRRLSSGSRRSGGLPYIAQLQGKDRPLYLEIASNNTMFIVSGEDVAGSNPKAWRAEFGFATKSTSAAVWTRQVRRSEGQVRRRLASAMGNCGWPDELLNHEKILKKRVRQ